MRSAERRRALAHLFVAKATSLKCRLEAKEGCYLDIVLYSEMISSSLLIEGLFPVNALHNAALVFNLDGDMLVTTDLFCLYGVSLLLPFLLRWLNANLFKSIKSGYPHTTAISSGLRHVVPVTLISRASSESCDPWGLLSWVAGDAKGSEKTKWPMAPVWPTRAIKLMLIVKAP